MHGLVVRYPDCRTSLVMLILFPVRYCHDSSPCPSQPVRRELPVNHSLAWPLWLLFLAVTLPPVSGADVPGADLFAGTNVPAFVVEIDAAGVESLRREPRTEARCTVRVGEEVFKDVGVHIKGSQGSLQRIDQRPALTITFNRFVAKQKCHGLRKLHLNNSAEDSSFMTDILCVEMHRQAGVPAARSAHVTLQLNQRNLGLYVLKEGLTKDFLEQHFSKTGGNLYDGGFQQDIDQPCERLQGKGADDQQDLKALVKAAREPDAATRWEQLNRQLDMDRFITGLAMQVITWNWDGYAMARNNYRIYHDPETDKLVFLPHTMDQMFWKPMGTIYPRMAGLVARGVMSTPEGKRRYRERLSQLQTNGFDVAALGKRLDALAALIKPYRPGAEQSAAGLKRALAERWQSIADQLAQPEPVAVEFADGVAALKQWRKATAQGELTEGKVDGKAVLSLKLSQNTNAAWTTRIWLPAGMYEFTARLRVKAAPNDSLAGAAGIRATVDGRPYLWRAVAGEDWQDITGRFAVPGQDASVDLACELRASGEAVFEVDSLKIQRWRGGVAPRFLRPPQ